MNTKQLLVLAISTCALATQMQAMQPLQDRETDAQKARRLRESAAQAKAPMSPEEWELEKILSAQLAADILDADEAEERAFCAAQDEAIARTIYEKELAERTVAELLANDEAIENTMQEEAHMAYMRTRNDAIIAREIAAQLRAQEREEQERASFEFAQRLQTELNKN